MATTTTTEAPATGTQPDATDDGGQPADESAAGASQDQVAPDDGGSLAGDEQFHEDGSGGEAQVSQEEVVAQHGDGAAVGGNGQAAAGEIQSGDVQGLDAGAGEMVLDPQALSQSEEASASAAASTAASTPAPPANRLTAAAIGAVLFLTIVVADLLRRLARARHRLAVDLPRRR